MRDLPPGAHRQFGVFTTAAAHLWRLPLLPPAIHGCITLPNTRTGDTRGVHLHRCGPTPRGERRIADVAVSGPARTIVDLAREHGMETAVVAADAALRTGLTSTAALQRTLAATATWPGWAAAVAAVVATDGRAESPLESLSRLRLARTSLPQVPIFDEHGAFLGRVDFYWDGVVGEADGLTKYDQGPHVLRREKRRQDALDRTGLKVVRWGMQDLPRFELVEGWLWRAIGAAAAVPLGERRWRLGRTAPLSAVS